MESRLMRLTAKQLRKLAFDFARSLMIPHNFNKETSLAGYDWLSCFMKRHDLSNRKAKPTSAARANGFNKAEVDNFFNLLKSYQDKFKFTSARIWYVDETGVSVVPKGLSRVIARRGRKQVGGKTICMSASEVFMPPMLIFPPVNENVKFLEGKPDGAWAEWHKSGWIQIDCLPNGLRSL